MDLLSSRRGRRLLFGALYLSEGAPVGFLWWYLPTVLRTEAVPIERITGLVASLALPWALKFLWAPLVDILRGPRWGFRAWIVTTQVGMGAAFLPLFFLDLRADFDAIYAFLLVHAVAASFQDAAIDALAIRSTPPGERGGLNAWMTAGNYGGRALLGGGALALVGTVAPDGSVVDGVDPRWIYGGLLLLVWSSLALVLAAKEPAGEAGRGAPLGEFLAALRAAARRANTWIGLLYAAVAAAAFEAAGGLAGLFLTDLGVPKETVGFLFAVPFIAGIVAGGFLGGWIHDRVGGRRSAGISQAGFAAVVLALAGAAPFTGEGSTTLPMVLLGILYLAVGIYTAASYALFMGLTDPRLGATQFSAFMGATNLCESGSIAMAGNLVARSGYPAAFAAAAAISLVSLPLLLFLRPGPVPAEGEAA